MKPLGCRAPWPKGKASHRKTKQHEAELQKKAEEQQKASPAVSSNSQDKGDSGPVSMDTDHGRKGRRDENSEVDKDEPKAKGAKVD